MKSSIPKMQIHQHDQKQPQRSMRGGGGAGDSPRGRLRSGAPEGVQLCWTTGQILANPQTPGQPRVVPPFGAKCASWLQLDPNLVQLDRLVRHVRLSCPTWLLLGSNLVHLCSNLAQLSANLAQLGPILAQLGSNLVQFWSQLGPTWSQNLTKMNFKSCFLATPRDVQFCNDF